LIDQFLGRHVWETQKKLKKDIVWVSFLFSRNYT
jgi:hypothetical protein